jgi:hypothetical protein
MYKYLDANTVALIFRKVFITLQVCKAGQML